MSICKKKYKYLALFDKKWVMSGLAFVAFAWAVIGSEMIFPFYSNNPDEAVYIFQARALAQGQLFLSIDPQFSEFFKAFDIINLGDRAVFKVTPVHAAFLALGLRLCGSMRAALGFVAAGNVLLLYCLSRELYPQKRPALIAAAFLLLSPFFLIQSATFLSYATTLLLFLTFAVLLLRGHRRNAPLLLFGAGLALGLAFFARPGDVLLFALPFGLLFVGLNLSGPKGYKNFSGLLKQSGWVLLGFGPMVGLALAYNQFLTGAAFIPLYWFWDPQDIPGFGRRAQNTILYDWPAALESLQGNLLQLALWVFGGIILPGLALFQLITQRLRQRELTLLLLLFIFPGAYLFFWGNYHFTLLGVNQNLGPMYYFPVLVPLVILAAQGSMNLSKARPGVAQFAVALMLLVNVWLLAWHIAQNYAYTRESQAIYRPFMEQRLDNTLVFVPPLASGAFLLAPLSYLINAPTLDGPILYAVNRNNENFVLLDAYPERTPYRFDYYGPYTKTPYDHPETVLVKLERRQVGSLAQRLQIINPTDNSYVFIEVLNNGQAETYLLDDSSTPGKRYVVEWRISPQNIEFQGSYHQHLSSIINLSPADKLVISVALSDRPERQTQQVFERRYNFRLTDDNRLDILVPPEEWYNSFWPVTEWLMGDIDHVITETQQ
ncbi:MAG: glycosyltransferase family 39 protein [Anaerolineae bacterium]|nr:glycosyltransferase family 39 protein [Anaerolineae bacterium]